MEDPARPDHGFFVDGAEKIFLKEIAYVQKGYLSDVPDLNYNFIRHICQRTQFIFFRNIPHPLEQRPRGLSHAPARRPASVCQGGWAAH